MFQKKLSRMYLTLFLCTIISLPIHFHLHTITLSSSAGSQSAIILKLLQPEDPFCPGDNVVLACSVSSTSSPPTLYWRQIGFLPAYYYNGPPLVLSKSFGDFDSTAHFSNNYYTIASNATLNDVMLSHNGIVISCYTPSSVTMTFVFKVIGMNTHNL